jgi:transposase
VSRLEFMVEPNVTPVRRVEVITGASGRRRWTADEKARVVEETLQPDAVVSEVARRHGLTPQQLFSWRRTMRRKSPSSESVGSPAFVPAVVETGETAASDIKTIARPHVIELDIGGDSVWIWRGADAAIVTAIIGLLKASR